MRHYVDVFLAISVLQVNMHTLITKKDSQLRVLHYITLDAEGTGFEVQGVYAQTGGDTNEKSADL